MVKGNANSLRLMPDGGGGQLDDLPQDIKNTRYPGLPPTLYMCLLHGSANIILEISIAAVYWMAVVIVTVAEFVVVVVVGKNEQSRENKKCN